NDRLVGVVETRHNPPEVRSLDELPSARLDEIEHFFTSYNEAEGRRFKPVGRRGPAAARRLVDRGAEQFRRSGRAARPAAEAGGQGRGDDPGRGADSTPAPKGGDAKPGQLRETESGTEGVRRIVRRHVGKALDAL